ncbi:hypothetical protein NBRC116594_13400 [Shimia sp. NS0008-38b]
MSPSAAPATSSDMSKSATRSLRNLSETTWVWIAIAALVTLWGTSIALFGVPGLYIPAVALVPVIFLALVLISRG